MEKNLRPNIGKLQEVGLFIKDISGIIAGNPYIFRTNFVSKIDCLMGVLGSSENLSVMFKARWNSLFSCNLEKVLTPNIYFLQEQCGLSTRQITRLMKSVPRLISSRPHVFKMKVEMAEKLGIARSSDYFVYALIIVTSLSQHTIDARQSNLRSLGISQGEVLLMISKAPMLLGIPEKLVGSKMEYLIKEAGFDKSDVVQYPAFLSYSLENRLIPRNIVRKHLMSKGLPVVNYKFACFIQLSEENFVKKFVLPYEHNIPGVYRAYVDASTGKIVGVESFKSILS